MRCLMGFSVGGEYPAVATYLFESAPPHHRGLVTSSAAAASEIGGLMAVGLCAWLTATLPAQSLDTCGWRIPFVFGALLAAAIWLAWRIIPESPGFLSDQVSRAQRAAPMSDALTHQRKGIGIGFAISALGSISYHGGITYVPSFMNLVGWPDDAVALGLSTVAAMVVIVVTPCIGWLSDRVGRKAVLLATCVACAALPFAMFSMIAGGEKPTALFAVVVLAALAGGVSAVRAVAAAGQFSAHTRLSGLAIGATTATAIFGGAAPYGAYLVQTWTGATGTPGIMIAVVAAMSGLVLLRTMLGRTAPSRREG